jgi:hypothetical protein
MFRIKQNPDGSIECYKARFAKGFSQRPGVDFNKTFAPTAKLSSLRTLYAIGALEDLHIDLIDITTAFLNGDVDFDMWINQMGFSKEIWCVS